MVGDLAAKVELLRTELRRRSDGIVLGDLPAGLPTDPVADLPSGLGAVLSLTNGPRCGSVVLFAEPELPANQFYCEVLDGGSATWLCFGVCDDVPLFVDRYSGQVRWDPDEDENLQLLAEDVEVFFDHYALGSGYAKLTSPAGDPWWEFLQDVNPMEEGT